MTGIGDSAVKYVRELFIWFNKLEHDIFFISSFIFNLLLFVVLAFLSAVALERGGVTNWFHSKWREFVHVAQLIYFTTLNAELIELNEIENKFKRVENEGLVTPLHLATFLDHVRHHCHWSRGARGWRGWRLARQWAATFVHLTVERHDDMDAALVHWWLEDFVCFALFYMSA